MPVIAGIEITTDNQGRFNLNGLHRASGGENGDPKVPAEWMRQKRTKHLIKALEADLDKHGKSHIKTIVSKSGRYGGTFAHEILAVEYAGWVSPAFRDFIYSILKAERNP